MSLPDRPEEWTVEELETVLQELRDRDPDKYKELTELIYSVSKSLSLTRSTTP